MAIGFSIFGGKFGSEARPQEETSILTAYLDSLTEEERKKQKKFFDDLSSAQKNYISFPASHTPAYAEALKKIIDESVIARQSIAPQYGRLSPNWGRYTLNSTTGSDLEITGKSATIKDGKKLTAEKAHALAMAIYLNPRAKGGVYLQGTDAEKQILQAALDKVIALNPDGPKIEIKNRVEISKKPDPSNKKSDPSKKGKEAVWPPMNYDGSAPIKKEVLDQLNADHGIAAKIYKEITNLLSMGDPIESDQDILDFWKNNTKEHEVITNKATELATSDGTLGKKVEASPADAETPPNDAKDSDKKDAQDVKIPDNPLNDVSTEPTTGEKIVEANDIPDSDLMKMTASSTSAGCSGAFNKAKSRAAEEDLLQSVGKHIIAAQKATVPFITESFPDVSEYKAKKLIQELQEKGVLGAYNSSKKSYKVCFKFRNAAEHTTGNATCAQDTPVRHAAGGQAPGAAPV